MAVPIRARVDVSHFVMRGPRLARGFNVTTCERCGEQVEDVNAVTLHETRERLLNLGLMELEHELQELLLAEHLGGICVCSTCYNITLAEHELASRRRYSIHLTNLSGSMPQLEPRVARLTAALQGQSHMDLDLVAAPMGGGVHVTVSGLAVNEKELTAMVLGILTEAVAKGGAA
jgi:hypothetical protein